MRRNSECSAEGSGCNWILVLLVQPDDEREEAGCTNAEILNHCCLPGEHVRGCWVLDLLLGKE